MKINRKLNKLLFAGFLGLLMVGCEYEQDYPPANRPIASISPLTVTASEGDTLTFTITLDRPTDYLSQFKFTVIDEQSQADDKEDITASLPDYGPPFSFGDPGYAIDVPNLATEFTFQVIVNEDILAEDMETAVFRFEATKTARTAVQNTQQLVKIDIQNTEEYHGFTSEDLGVRVDWRGEAAFPYLTINADGDTVEVVDDHFDLSQLDFDVQLYQNNTLLGYIAGTAAVPEVGVLGASSLADGTYGIYIDYYASGPVFDALLPIYVPITLTTSNIGLADGSAVYPELYQIDTPTGAEGGAPAKIATLVKSGSHYTVTNAITGELIYETP